MDMTRQHTWFQNLKPTNVRPETFCTLKLAAAISGIEQAIAYPAIPEVHREQDDYYDRGDDIIRGDEAAQDIGGDGSYAKEEEEEKGDWVCRLSDRNTLIQVCVVFVHEHWGTCRNIPARPTSFGQACRTNLRSSWTYQTPCRQVLRWRYSPPRGWWVSAPLALE